MMTMATTLTNNPEHTELVGYVRAVPREDEPQITGVLYDYVLAGNGVFIRAKRPEMKVQFQIGVCEVRGLPELEEIFEWDFEPVARETVERMLSIARAEAIEDREVLFHLTRGEMSSWNNGWELVRPPQLADGGHCKPLEDGPGSSHASALIECHSHHNMRAYFSGIDDADEQGFRIYAVMGTVLSAPEIRVRVGVHGYFWDIDPRWVFELPDEMTEGFAEESSE